MMNPSPNGIITLTTDFGTADPYVGMMKGVILEVFPEARIVDLCHEVPAGEVKVAAWMLKDAVPFFPEGTVHLAVVDPGVGSSRRGLVLCSRGHFFVGPDNGIFSAFLPASAVVLDRPEFFLPRISRTFHGRDVFAPVAARLAQGLALGELGTLFADPVVLALAEPKREGEVVRGEVVQVDRFGNLVTNIPAEILGEGSGVFIRLGDKTISGVSACYAAGKKGELLALIGSSGRLEIAVREGSACAAIPAGRGDKVEIILGNK